MNRDAILRDPAPNLDVLFLNGKYKPFQICSSRSIRENVYPRRNFPSFKLEIENVGNFIRKLQGVKCTRLKNLGLRLIHGDIFTKEKLFQKNIIENATCDKCNHNESTKHLLFECWYAGRIWNRVKQLYEKTDSRAITYDVNLNFVMANSEGMNKPKMLLHLEIIRLLTQKDRPTALPRTIIKSAVDYLLVCEKTANTERCLNKLGSELDGQN